ncbi:MAG: hypothetical protein JXA82_18020 [Sedimentisphaerales bacterium]|nr:hypothetical protein [Sedimentisphaerales bacterium]
MEVCTTESISYKYFLCYLIIGTLYLGLIIIPGLWWPVFYTVLGSLVFGLILFFSLRSHIQAGFALRKESVKKLQEESLPTVSIVIPSFNEEAVLR